MELTQATMQLSKMYDGVEKKVNKLVMLWEHVGLCYHKNVYDINKRYVISHYRSGKIVLRGLKSIEQCQVYMKRLVEIQANWNFSEEEWNQVDPETKQVFKVEVDKLNAELAEWGTA